MPVHLVHEGHLYLVRLCQVGGGNHGLDQQVCHQGGAYGLAQLQIQLHNRCQPQLVQHIFVPRLAADVGGCHVVLHSRADGGSNQGGCTGVEAVQDGQHAAAGTADNQSGNSTQLEAAYLGKHVKRIRGIRLVYFQHLFDRGDFRLQPLVGDIGAPAGSQLRADAAHNGSDGGAGSGVGNAHFPRQQDGEIMLCCLAGHSDACHDGGCRLLSGHSRALGGILGAVAQLHGAVNRQLAGIPIDAYIEHTQGCLGKIGKGIGSPALGNNVVGCHVQGGFRRIGTDIFLRHAMVGTENGGKRRPHGFQGHAHYCYITLGKFPENTDAVLRRHPSVYDLGVLIGILLLDRLDGLADYFLDESFIAHFAHFCHDFFLGNGKCLVVGISYLYVPFGCLAQLALF